MRMLLFFVVFFFPDCSPFLNSFRNDTSQDIINKTSLNVESMNFTDLLVKSCVNVRILHAYCSYCSEFTRSKISFFLKFWLTYFLRPASRLLSSFQSSFLTLLQAIVNDYNNIQRHVNINEESANITLAMHHGLWRSWSYGLNGPPGFVCFFFLFFFVFCFCFFVFCFF